MDPRWNEETNPCDIALSMPHDARRADRRSGRFGCEVVSHYGDEPEQRVCTDVSTLGMWIETDMPLHPGSEVVVGFRVPADEEELLLFATVTRVRTGRKKGDRGAIGMGIEFRDPSREDRSRIGNGLPRPAIERRPCAAA